MQHIYLENVKFDYLKYWILKYWKDRKDNQYPIKNPPSIYIIRSTSSFTAYGEDQTVLVEGDYLFYGYYTIEDQTLIRLEFQPWTDELIRIDIIECIPPLREEFLNMLKEPWFANSIKRIEETLSDKEKEIQKTNPKAFIVLSEEDKKRLLSKQINSIDPEHSTTIDEDQSSQNSDNSKKPWEYIDDVGQDIKIIKLWCQCLQNSQIGERLGLNKKYVTNRISTLRQKYPEAHIPTAKEKRERLIKQNQD